MNKSQTFKEVSEEIVSIYGKLIKQNTKSNFIDCAKELETEFDKIYEVFDVDSDNINKFSEINKKIENIYQYVLQGDENIDCYTAVNLALRQYLVNLENIAEEYRKRDDRDKCIEIFKRALQIVDLILENGRLLYPVEFMRVKKYYKRKIKNPDYTFSTKKESYFFSFLKKHFWKIVLSVVVVCTILSGFVDDGNDGKTHWNDLTDDEKAWYERNYGDGKSEEYNQAIEDYKSGY